MTGSNLLLDKEIFIRQKTFYHLTRKRVLAQQEIIN